MLALAGVLFAIIVLAASDSVAAASPCALYVKNGEVCLHQEERTVCQALLKDEIDDVQEYRCIITDISELGENCEVTVVAQNHQIFFKPFRLRHTALYIPKPTRKIHSAEQMKKYCLPLQSRQLK